MKKLAITITAVFGVVFLSSCEKATYEEHEVILDDGRIVSCLYFDGFYGGGPSCDWENATQVRR